jgi:hypothetical protein
MNLYQYTRCRLLLVVRHCMEIAIHESCLGSSLFAHTSMRCLEDHGAWVPSHNDSISILHLRGWGLCLAKAQTGTLEAGNVSELDSTRTRSELRRYRIQMTKSDYRFWIVGEPTRSIKVHLQRGNHTWRDVQQPVFSSPGTE